MDWREGYTACLLKVSAKCQEHVSLELSRRVSDVAYSIVIWIPWAQFEVQIVAAFKSLSTFISHDRYMYMSVAYFRTVLGERRISCRGGLQPAEHLSAEAGLGWSASDTHESMPPGLCDLWPVKLRSVRDLRRRNSQQRRQTTLLYSQENFRRQTQRNDLQLASKYVCDEHSDHVL